MKKLIALLSLITIFSISTILIVGASTENSQEYDFVISGKNKDIPNEFKEIGKIETYIENFGISTYKDKDTKSEIDLKIKETNVDEDGNVLFVTGKGSINLSTGKYDFDFENSQLKKTTLEDGQTLIYGPIDGKIKTKEGEEKFLTLSVQFMPGTNNFLCNAVVGTLEEGVSILSFGKTFNEKEIDSIMIAEMEANKQ
ncbi:hypothetical protein AB4Z45_32835 [Paenibacillus sp. MCAF9]|uniref:hypothetical protein n=1 Tax=unclassified Paenibacillus TaxID=185978 RepID=UPI003F9B1A8A